MNCIFTDRSSGFTVDTYATRANHCFGSSNNLSLSRLACTFDDSLGAKSGHALVFRLEMPVLRANNSKHAAIYGVTRLDELMWQGID